MFPARYSTKVALKDMGALQAYQIFSHFTTPFRDGTIHLNFNHYISMLQ